MTARFSAHRARLLLFGSAVGLVVLTFLCFSIFSAESLPALVANIQATPDYGWILFVNVLISASVALFVVELRGGALRVTLTVVFALLLGYVMTALFSLDSASRFIQGEFKLELISEAAPLESDETDITYGGVRSGTINDPDAAEPQAQVRFVFQGQAADQVSVLAYGGNRRTEIDLQVALLGPDGARLASATGATEAQLAQYDNLRGLQDAVIEGLVLPADGLYTVVVEPEALAVGTVLQETIASTNQAYTALLLGPLSRVNRWAIWMQDAITLILVGLAITIVFQAEQFSLGAEGQLYFGALFSGFLALKVAGMSPAVGIPLALLSAATAGFVWGLLPGVLKAYLGANELVSTLMLNTVAMRFYDMALTFELKAPDAGFTTTGILPSSALLPVLVSGTQVTVAIFIVLIAVIATWLLISRTTIGYEIRMIGANQKFAEYGGVNTKRTIMLAMAFSGILAGLAGAHLGLGIHRQLILNISLGLAFEGVVVSLLARNNPLVVPFTGLLYAYLRAGAQFMERDANISFEIVRIVQAVIILLITAEGIFTFLQARRMRRRTEQAVVPGDDFEDQPVSSDASVTV